MISKTALHTLKAAVVLAQDPEQRYHGAGEIAKAIDAPANYLGKMLQTLARQGVLISQKGLGGGFKLARDPHEITLYEVVEGIDDLSRLSGCFLGRSKCSADHPCPLHQQWGRIRGNYLAMLNNFTLADLASHTHGTRI